jgi:hypothetical protein
MLHVIRIIGDGDDVSQFPCRANDSGSSVSVSAISATLLF